MVFCFQVGTLQSKDSPGPHQEHSKIPKPTAILPESPTSMECSRADKNGSWQGSNSLWLCLFWEDNLLPHQAHSLPGTRAPTQPCRSLTSWLFPSEKLGTHSTNWDMVSTRVQRLLSRGCRGTQSNSSLKALGPLYLPTASFLLTRDSAKGAGERRGALQNEISKKSSQSVSEGCMLGSLRGLEG